MSSVTMDMRRRALGAAGPLRLGRVSELAGLHLVVTGLAAGVGDLVQIDPHGSQDEPVLAEVAASGPHGLICLPLAHTTGLRTGALVRHCGGPLQIRIGPDLRGRVLDGLGRPIDGGRSLDHLPQVPVTSRAPGALVRPPISRQVGLGVRALDTLVPCGRGQRIGIMAGSGVGKSSLLSMVARGTDAQISVIALIGERGREVREFIDNDLGPDGLARSVVVVATSDAPPVERLRAAFVATRIAESFRDAGKHVVLMMDSLTRVAMAQREIGLSAGEPPATRGYPPSVFALLPTLLERAGTSPAGSITGLYTVLVEGDDLHDPIGDSARAILDGHVVLSRSLATSGHFPSIDVLESISRLMPAVTDAQQQECATALRRMLAAHRNVRELVEIGAYVPGADVDADRALALMPQIRAFLQQSMTESTAAPVSWGMLADLLGEAP